MLLATDTGLLLATDHPVVLPRDNGAPNIPETGRGDVAHIGPDLRAVSATKAILDRATALRCWPY